MEYLKKIDNYWLKIPVTLYILGFFVHNIYLSSFALYNFDILHTRYIYSGTIAFAFIIILIFALTMKLDLSNYEKNFKYLNLTSWICRVCIITFILYYVLNTNELSIFTVVTNFRELINLCSKIFLIIIVPPLIMWSIIDMLGNISKNDEMFSLINKIIHSYLSYPFIAIIVFISYYNVSFRQITLFVFYLWFAIAAYIFGILEARKGRAVQIIEGQEGSLKPSFYKKVFAPVSLLLGIVFVITLYSSHIYSKIPANWGGAKPIEAKIFIDSDTLAVQIVDESEKWIAVISSCDTTLRRIKIENVTSVIIKNKKK